jgi:phosphotransacetylase
MHTKARENLQRLIAAVKALPPTPTAVAHPCDESSLAGAIDAANLGIIAPIRVGPRQRILAVASAAKLDDSAYEIVDAEHGHAAAEKAVALVREGRAEMLMKGSLNTDELMAAVVRCDTGLRTGRRLSHCFILDVPNPPKPLIITDAASNIFPTLEDKVDILQNAISLEAAQIKSTGPVAGHADILVVPDLEAGNMLAKSLSFLADADSAGLVLGARVPITLTSRADSVQSRLASCAVVAVARRRELAGRVH